MKKINSIILGLIAVCTFIACSDDQYTSRYDNPGKTTKISCDKMMTGVFYNGKDFTYNAYWRMYTWENIFGKYTQTIGYFNGTGSVYFYNDGYANDRWANFYKTLAQFRTLENLYNSESESVQANDRIFKDLSEIFVYDHLSQIVDLFGAVPFSAAGYLGVDGDLTKDRPVFDNDATLYKMMLTRLGELYTDIQTLKSSLSALTTKSLSSQDFINKGNLDKWLMYANSLRLRLAVHVAAQGTLTSDAKSAITECLSRSLVTTDDNQIEVYPDADGFNYKDDFRNGYKDINNVASQYMINAMTKVSSQKDYRLFVMYMPNAEGKYIGMDRTETQDFQTNHGSGFNGFGNLAFNKTYYSYLDSVTYTDNKNFISPIISAAEVDFLKAEIYQNGWATGNAEQAFVNGMVNSTKFYYRQNKVSISTQGYVGTYPGDAAVQAYAEKLWATYSNKLEAIMTQKWVHFGIIQPTQAWTDIRRTGYPALTYPTDANSQAFKTIPNRIQYPNTEAANNKANYDAVVATQGDDSYTKLFWAK